MLRATSAPSLLPGSSGWRAGSPPSMTSIDVVDSSSCSTARWLQLWEGCACPPLADQPELSGLGNGLGAVHGSELVQDVGHVLLHGVERDDEVIGDLPIRPSAGEHRQDLQLPISEDLDQARRNVSGRLP